MCSVSFQPSRPSLRRGLARGVAHVLRECRRAPPRSVTKSAKSLVASSTLSWKREPSARELLLDLEEARLLRRRQLGAAEAEIAQLVVDVALARRRIRRESAGARAAP